MSLLAFQRFWPPGMRRRPRPRPRRVGPLPPRVALERVLPVAAASSLDQLAAQRPRRSCAATPTWCSVAVVVVEAEQQRPDALAVLVRAEPGDDAVGGALVLDLQPSCARPRRYGAVERLGDRRRRAPRPRSARTSSAAVAGRRSPASGGRAASRRRSAASSRGPPLGERLRPQVVVALGEQVEGDERDGVSSASIFTRDSAGWMRSESRSKSSPSSVAMTISPSSTHRSGSAASSGSTQLGEVAGQRLLVAAAELDVVAVAEHDAAEAVPLRLVEQTSPVVGRSRASLASIGDDRRAGRGSFTSTARRERRRATTSSSASSSSLAGRAVLALDDARAETLGADDELHRHAERGRRRRTSRPGSRRGRRRARATPARRARRRAVGRLRPRSAAASPSPGSDDEVDVVRREDRRPGDAVLVVVLLDDRGDDPARRRCRSSP